jgi:hypothetical protein
MYVFAKIVITLFKFCCRLTEKLFMDVVVYSWRVGKHDPVGPDRKEDPETEAAFFTARGQQIHEDVSRLRELDT